MRDWRTRIDFMARSWVMLAGAALWGTTSAAWADPPAAPATSPAAVTTERWEAAIAAYEKEDAVMRPPTGGNVFVGSSSIRLWPVAKSFPDLPCVNRGFGGSQLPDVLKYVERIVTPYQPAVVLLYCGDNDLAAKRTPEQVRDDYREFVTRVREKCPEAKIVWITIKPSLKRWALREEIQRANALVLASQQDQSNEAYVDVWTPALNEEGTPTPELFVKDGLHLSPAGYALWNEHVRPHLVESPAER